MPTAPAPAPAAAPVYSPDAPARSDIDAGTGPLLLQFGVAWCGHCLVAEPAIVQALQAHPQLVHLRIEDGPGRALGRSFKVKLWPTLVLTVRGQEVARVVRPTHVEQVQALLSHLPGGV
jgi:thioredoxin 1